MRKNSWIHVIIKVLALGLIIGALHKNQLFVNLLKSVDVSYLTSFKSLGVQEIVNDPLHLVSTKDSTTMMVHQVYEAEKKPLEVLDTSVNNDEDMVKKKRIYIYNTHQYEQYATHTVMDGARYLKSQLESLGYEVIVEENDFEAFKRANNMDLTETYPTSRIFLEKALEEYGSFDLIIDYHRDAISKEASTFTDGNLSYAKMMMVVSLSSINHETVEANSATLHQAVDARAAGIMRYDFKRENVYYNQQYASPMLLMEIGGMDNTFEEVQNSLNVLAFAIDDCFQKGSFK